VLLTPAEQDRLLLFTAAQLARARRARGLRLNVPEATALIADTVVEAARDGRRLADAAEAGRQVLTADDVLPGVPEVVGDVMVEAGFDDGTRLVVVTDPFRLGSAEPSAATPVLSAAMPAPGAAMPAPGAVLTGEGLARSAALRQTFPVEVLNTGQVPVSVTSHWHFFEANPRLQFDRSQTYGRRLDIPAGSVIRFDPGVPQQVHLVDYGGDRVVIGFAGLVDGPLDAPGARDRALGLARERGYLGA
jgi:urease subunit gamma/beta